MNIPIVWLDIETTSLRHDRQAWEIAVIRRAPDGTETRLHLFVTEVDLADADPRSLDVCGYWDRHPEPLGEGFCWTPAPVNPEGAQLVTTPQAARLVHKHTHRAVVVGSNPAFDTHTLDRLLRDHNLTPTWHYRTYDIATLALGYLKGHGDRNVVELHKADPGAVYAPPVTARIPVPTYALSRMCGIEPPGPGQAHTAMGDAEWVKRWWDHLTQDRAPR